MLHQQVVIPPRMKQRRRPKPSRWIPALYNMVTLEGARVDVDVNVLLQVRFNRPESEQARQRRIHSYEFLQKKQAEEPWVYLQYHGVKVGELSRYSGSKSWVIIFVGVNVVGSGGWKCLR